MKNLDKLLSNKYIKTKSIHKIINKNRDYGGTFFNQFDLDILNCKFSGNVFYLNPAVVGRKQNFGYFTITEAIPGLKPNSLIVKVNINTGRSVKILDYRSKSLSATYAELLEILLNERIAK